MNLAAMNAETWSDVGDPLEVSEHIKVSVTVPLFRSV